MTKYEKEILQAQLDLEEKIGHDLKAAIQRALNKIAQKVKELQLSEIMEKLPEAAAFSVLDTSGEPIELPQQRGQVYQAQYQREITESVQEPIQALETETQEIVKRSFWEYFALGALATMYLLHRQKTPLIFPVSSSAQHVDAAKCTSGIKVTFSDVHVAESYKYIRNAYRDLQVRSVADISRHIANGVPYNKIARDMANNMNATPFSKAYSKAMTIVRTEGGRIRSEAEYQVQLAAKSRGADIVKEWSATLDGKTRDSHMLVDGEVREIEDRFSNGLLYPCEAGQAAAEVINCRCVALTRVRRALNNGFSKMDNFTKEIRDFNTPEDYATFKEAYWSKENLAYMRYLDTLEKRYSTKNFSKLLAQMSEREYKHFHDLETASPLWGGKGT
nr:MAG TPA: minor capsid protein [Caudoviricetes sp.]